MTGPGIREGPGDRRARTRKECEQTLRLRESLRRIVTELYATMPLMYRDQQGRARPFFRRSCRRGVHGQEPCGSSIRLSIVDRLLHRLDAVPSRVSWKDAQNVLPRQPEAFRDRLILVGGEFAGSGDVYRNVPHTSARPAEVSGLVLQALTLNVLLEGQPIKALNGTFVVISLCAALGIAVMAVLSVSGRPWMLGTLAVCGIVYVLLSFLLFRWNRRAVADRRARSGLLPRDRVRRTPAPASYPHTLELRWKRRGYETSAWCRRHAPLAALRRAVSSSHRLRRCRKNPWRSCACSRVRALAKFDNKRTGTQTISPSQTWNRRGDRGRFESRAGILHRRSVRIRGKGFWNSGPYRS